MQQTKKCDKWNNATNWINATNDKDIIPSWSLVALRWCHELKHRTELMNVEKLISESSQMDRSCRTSGSTVWRWTLPILPAFHNLTVTLATHWGTFITGDDCLSTSQCAVYVFNRPKFCLPKIENDDYLIPSPVCKTWPERGSEGMSAGVKWLWKR